MSNQLLEEIIESFTENLDMNEEQIKHTDKLCQEAIRIGMEINNFYHPPEELRELMSNLTGKDIDPSFRMFPPFYTDFGKNITIGKNVFINSGCHFQDQGGIYHWEWNFNWS